MNQLFQLLFIGTALAAAMIAWSLLWSDAMDRRRAIRAAHDAKWSCACSCPGLTGFHSHKRCVFNA